MKGKAQQRKIFLPCPLPFSFLFFSSSLVSSSMGFPSVCYCVILPWPLAVLLQILDQTRLFFFTLLHFLGLLRPPPAPISSEDAIYSLLLTDIPSIPTRPSSIKERLPVAQFSTVRGLIPSAYVDNEPVCAVCLCGIEGRHEVRKLGSCSHAFHKVCIDKWVDLGNVTCPLCRSRLLPRCTPGRRRTPFLAPPVRSGSR